MTSSSASGIHLKEMKTLIQETYAPPFSVPHAQTARIRRQPVSMNEGVGKTRRWTWQPPLTRFLQFQLPAVSCVQIILNAKLLK